jgi:ferredoxin-type protein NapF
MSDKDEQLDRRAVLFGKWRRSDPVQPPATVAPRAINWVRPPGAIDPSLFVQTCDGCAACADVCPAQAISMTGPAVAGRKPGPRIDGAQSPCVMCDDIVCVEACPTNALAPIDRGAVRIAQIRFDEARCLAAVGEDPDCRVCVDRCPVGATAITMTVRNGPTISPACTGCGVCVHYCPATPPPLIQLPPIL